MKVTVNQFVYVAADKTRAFVIVLDGDGNEIDSQHFTHSAYPLADIARDTYRFVTDAVKDEIKPDVIVYRCNVLGTYEVTKESGRYESKLVHSRHFRDGRRRILAPQVAEQTEETDEHE